MRSVFPKSMPSVLMPLALASALFAAVPAHAEIARATFFAGSDHLCGAFGPCVDLSGGGELAFTGDFIRQLNGGRVRLDPVGETTVIEGRPTVDGPLVQMPVLAVSGTYNSEDRIFSASTLRVQDGVSLVFMPSGRPGDGPSLSMSDFKLDVEGNTVYATVKASRESAKSTNVPMWTYANEIGSTSFSVVNGVHIMNIDTGPLSLTPQALTHFKQAFNLPDARLDALGELTDVGRFTVQARFDVSGAPVPEPATWALMGLGLVAMGGAKRLKRPQA